MRTYFTLLILSTYILFSQPEIQRTNGPNSANVNDFQVFQNELYCGTDNESSTGGVYKLNGYVWENISDGLIKNDKIIDLFEMNDNLYALTLRSGLFMLEEGKWQSISDDIIFAKKVVNYKNSIVVVSKNNGLFRTKDNGLTWTNISFNISDRVFETAFVHEGNFYVGTYDYGVYLFDEENETWEQRSNGLNIGTNTVISCISSVNDYLIASDFRGQFLSSDKGMTWVESKEIYENGAYADFYYKIDDDFYEVSNHEIHKLNGDSWEKVYQTGYNKIHAFIKFQDEYYFANNNWGVYKFDQNFGDSINVLNGLNNSHLTKLHEINGVIYASQAVNDFGLIYRSSDEGENWERLENGLTFIGFSSIYSQGDIVLAGSDGSGLYISTDKGDRWEKAKGSRGYVGACIMKEDNIIIAQNGFSEGVKISKDFGDTFEHIDDLPLDGTNHFIERNNILYAGTRSEGIYRSENNGESWSEFNNGLKTEGGYVFVNDLETDGNNLIVNTFNNLYTFNEESESWKRLNYDSTVVDKINCSYIHNNLILVGTRNKNIYYSYDGGLNFSKLSDEESFAVEMYDIKVFDDQIYFASYGAGVWKLPLAMFGTNSVEQHSDNDLVLYPNPTKEFLKINSDKLKTNCDIKIYDLKGNILIDMKDVKINSEIINLDLVNTGTYLISIENTNYKEVRMFVKE